MWHCWGFRLLAMHEAVPTINVLSGQPLFPLYLAELCPQLCVHRSPLCLPTSLLWAPPPRLLHPPDPQMPVSSPGSVSCQSPLDTGLSSFS